MTLLDLPEAAESWRRLGGRRVTPEGPNGLAPGEVQIEGRLIHYNVEGIPDLDDDGSPRPAVVVDLRAQPSAEPRVELPDRLAHFRLYSIDELRELPPVEWLLFEQLAAAQLTGLYGKGDTLKSFLAIHWAMTLAVQGKRVVYIASRGRRGSSRRIEAWKVVERQSRRTRRG